MPFKGRDLKRIGELIWKIDEEENIYKIARLKAELVRKVKQSSKEDQRLSYAKKVLQMWHDYEEMVFNLSEQSTNETVASIKAMSLGQRMKFQQLIVKRNIKSNPKNG